MHAIFCMFAPIFAIYACILLQGCAMFCRLPLRTVVSYRSWTTTTSRRIGEPHPTHHTIAYPHTAHNHTHTTSTPYPPSRTGTPYTHYITHPIPSHHTSHLAPHTSHLASRFSLFATRHLLLTAHCSLLTAHFLFVSTSHNRRNLLAARSSGIQFRSIVVGLTLHQDQVLRSTKQRTPIHLLLIPEPSFQIHLF